MTREECKTIIANPDIPDEEAVRALILFTGGPNDDPRNAEETMRLSIELAPFFKDHRPKIDRELVIRVSKECAKERLKYITEHNPGVRIVRIQTTPHT